MAGASTNATRKDTPWGLVILLGSLTAFAPMSIDLYLPSFPAITVDLGGTAAQTQATVAVFLAGMAIGQFFYGPASDRFGRRPPVLVGVTIYVAASVACALATSPDMLIAGRFVQALGGCAGAVVARAVIRDRFSHTETARMLAMMMMVMGLAPILAPLAGGALLKAFGWRANFWVLTGFGVVIGLACFFRLKESRSEETAAHARSETPLRAYLSVLSQRTVLGYCLSGAFNGAAIFTYISTAPDLVIGTYGISPSAFGWVFGANAAGMIFCGQINRQILRRWTPDQVLNVSSWVSAGLATALAVAAVTGWGGRWAVLGLLFTILGSYGFIQGNTMAGALSVDPRRSGSVSALMGALSYTAGAVASGMAGMFHDGTARPTALTVFGTMWGSALLLHALALPRKGRT